jgi:hypothetical protein
MVILIVLATAAESLTSITCGELAGQGIAKNIPAALSIGAMKLSVRSRSMKDSGK